MLKRNWFFLMLLLISCPVLSAQIIHHQNDSRHRLDLGINPYLFSPQSIRWGCFIYYDFNDGIQNHVIFQFDSQIKLSYLFNFYTALKVKNDYFLFDSFLFSWDLQPLKFLSFHCQYQVHSGFEYDSLEQNLLVKAKLNLDLKKRAVLTASSGINFRWTDLAVFSGPSPDSSDLLYEIIFDWQLSALFKINRFYQIELSLANNHHSRTISFGYFQIENCHYFDLPFHFRVFIQAGIGFAGSLVFSGNISRVWGGAGVQYKLFF